MTLERYIDRGFWPAVVCAGITFVFAWGYCTVSSGFLLGFGLGWIPAAISALIVFVIILFLWLPLIILVGAGVVLLTILILMFPGQTATPL